MPNSKFSTKKKYIYRYFIIYFTINLLLQCILSDINDSKLAFEVYDKDMIGVDDTIGCAFVNLFKKPSIVVRITQN